MQGIINNDTLPRLKIYIMNFINSGQMADKVFDVIVIGAGVEGSATAYQLTKLAGEKRIALVEQVFTA